LPETVLLDRLDTIQELAEEALEVALEVVLEEVVPIVAAEEALDHQDHQETMANQENLEHQEIPEMQDVHLLPLVNKQPHLRVILVQPVLRDLQAAQEHQETPDQMETQAKEEVTRSLAPQDQRAHPDLQDQTEIPEHQEIQEPQLRAKKPAQDNQDQQEIPAHQDLQDQQDNQVNQEDQDNPDQKDQMETQEPQETTVNLVIQERAELQAVAEKKESARNTAPLTEESSSKMEHADVKARPCIQRTRRDLPKIPCPMNQQFPFFIIVAQKTAIYYVSIFYCIQEWRSIFGFFHSLFFLK